MPRLKISDKDRLMQKVMPEPNSGCWLWTASCWKTNPYSRFRLEGKNESGHRASYILFKGKIPKNMYVCHKCDVPTCVNPDHLFLGSSQDNTNDKIKKGRSNMIGRPCVLSEKQAKEIKHRIDKNGNELALEYGVSKSTISNIKLGIIFKNI